MHLFETLKQLIERYLPEEQIKKLRQAYSVARDAHEGQARSSGDPYITHPVAVACILAEMKLDYETLMAALLHDVIEDTSIDFQEMEKLFGTSIADLVEGVSKLDAIKFHDKKEEQAENFKKMIMAMVQDIRVILIKLADRTHNMRTLYALRPEKRRRIARETLEIYSPIARRLGIHYLKTHLEEMGFEALYPNRYRIIQKVVKSICNNRNAIIQKILADIGECLQKEKIPCRIFGREKDLYSIYCKMHLKEKSFHSIMDVYAFRVITKDIDTCYRILRKIHNLYKSRPKRIKDYIAIPKENGYQSLHTSMIGPNGISVKVQIRTEDMDHMAKMGIVTNWIHKKKTQSASYVQIHVQRWLRGLLELQKNASNSFEFIENVKSDLSPNEIYVFTTEGRMIELPTGSTPVDFAYAINVDIGNECIGARVDQQPYPLSRPLSSGQAVEIITSPGAQPNATWLNFVVSSRARIKIRQLLQSLKKEDQIDSEHRLVSNSLSEGHDVKEILSKKY